jgi:hypothetical protein
MVGELGSFGLVCQEIACFDHFGCAVFFRNVVVMAFNILSRGHCFIFDRNGLSDTWSFALVKLFHVDLMATWACDW